MDRNGFRNRLKQYKKAREENPGLKYWEWKGIPKYDEGTSMVGMPSTTSVDGRTKYIYYDPTMDLEYQNIHLPEVTVTGNKNAGKRLPIQVPKGSYERFKTLGEIGKTVGGFLPVAGEMIDTYDLATDIKNKDWTNTAIRVGGYLMPNALEKGFKYANNIYKKLRRYPQINVDNAHEITDKQWDRAYDRALQTSNETELQRLRDLHFSAKSNTIVKNDDGMPIKTYHTVADRYNPNFTEFNPTIEGTHSAIYTTNDPYMSGSYAKQIVSKEESDLLIDDKINELKKYFSRLITRSKNKDQQLEAYIDYLKYMGTDEIAKQNVINDYPKLAEIHPERMKKLYINLKNPLTVDAKGDSWGHISTAKLPENIWENITNPQPFLSTRDIESIYKHFGYDGAIIKNVVDYGGNKMSSRYLTPADVYEINNPVNLKLSDAVTYDDVGKVIPLSKRDNFNSSDIRYSLVPIGLMGLTGLKHFTQDEDVKNEFSTFN